MAMRNIIELEIDEKARSYAKIYSSLITNEFQRKRAYASITALYALSNLISKTKNTVQKAMTIFRNPAINEKYEVSDIYINDWHIDVRVMTDGDAFMVPRIHEEFSIEPDFYAVVKVDSSLQNAELLGFASPKRMTKNPLDYHYFSVDNSFLIGYDEFIEIIQDKKPLKLSKDDHQFFLENYLSLIDKEIDEVSLKRILKHLFLCPECRAEFCCFTGFEMVNCNLGKYPELLEDQTLDIIGAQAVEDEEYQGKEETIYFDKNEEILDTQEEEEEEEDNSTEEEEKEEETQEEEPQQEEEQIITTEETTVDTVVEEEMETQHKEESVSDILDELFNISDDDDEPEFNIIPEDIIVPDDIEEADLSEISNELEIIDDEEENSEQKETSLEDEEIEIFEDIEDEDLSDISDELELIEDDEIENDEQETDSVAESENIENIEDEEEHSVTDDEMTDLVEPNSELSIIEDEMTDLAEPDNELSIIEDEMTDLADSNGEIALIEDESVEINDSEEEISLIENTDDNLLEENEELALLEEDVDVELESIDEVEILEETPKETIDKVIVDYDESGEPIYSYITNVNTENNIEEIEEVELDDINQIDTIEEENEEILEYEEKSRTDEEYSIEDEISNDENKNEYDLEDEDEVETIEEEFIQDENEEELIDEEYEDNEEYVDEFDEYSVEDNEETNEEYSIEDEFSDDENDRISAQSVLNQYNPEDDETEDEQDYSDKTSEENSEEEEYTDTEDKEDEFAENTEDDEEYSDEDDDEEYSDEDDDEEYSDEDDDEEYSIDEIPETVQKGSSKKTLISISIAFVVIAFIATAITIMINRAINDENKAPAPQRQTQEQLANKATSDELFQSVDDNDVFAQLGYTQPETEENAPQTTDVTQESEVPSAPPIVDEQPPVAVEPPVASETPVVPENPITTETNTTKPLTEKDLLTKGPTNDLNKVMADAFSDQGQLVTSIKGLNWMCSPSLFSDPEFKAYLQNLDKSLKVNVNSNLLNSTTTPTNNSITYKMAIDNQGNLLKIQAASSTGSEELDSIVLQSIKETLVLQKTQIISNSQQKADKYLLQVVIKF